MRQALHAYVEGYVQGVGFRVYVRQRAQFLGLKGWVRNTSAGEVEVHAEGEREDLEVLLRSLEKGPSGSSVKNVRAQWTSPGDEFDEFDIERSW